MNAVNAASNIENNCTGETCVRFSMGQAVECILFLKLQQFYPHHT